jgi:hypothetical protein
MQRNGRQVRKTADRAHRPRDGHNSLHLVKKSGNRDIGTSPEEERQELAVLVAVLSLGALAITILISIVIKLLGF